MTNYQNKQDANKARIGKNSTIETVHIEEGEARAGKVPNPKAGDADQPVKQPNLLARLRQILTGGSK